MTEETIVAHGSDKGLIHREERTFNLPRKKMGSTIEENLACTPPENIQTANMHLHLKQGQLHH